MLLLLVLCSCCLKSWGKKKKKRNQYLSQQAGQSLYFMSQFYANYGSVKMTKFGCMIRPLYFIYKIFLFNNYLLSASFSFLEFLFSPKKTLLSSLESLKLRYLVKLPFCILQLPVYVHQYNMTLTKYPHTILV